ncbi:HEAT repeat domain-containing protein [Opitutia bacterium ISCC 51]|nr:HEAT repeat domain-containing protein [Opitutae bacterium ISCC 51]QXD28709.1 HEAT repeat domain-containing protein [Opitutae bacterium ISCC 52]
MQLHRLKLASPFQAHDFSHFKNHIMYPKICLTTLSFLLAGTVLAQQLDLVPADRRSEPIIAPATNEGELALQIIQVPDDLDVNLWAAEPMLANPVAIDIDEKGRLFTSETNRYRTSTLDIRDYMEMLELDLASRTIEDRQALIHTVFEEEASQFELETEVIRVLEDTDGDGKADSSKIFADDFDEPLDGIASGVLARNGKVWFTNIPSLWMLEEDEATGTASKRTELARGFGIHFGYTGHDSHGMVFGPDGKLYFSIGDRGTNVTTQEGKVIELQDEGAVFRCNPDGSDFEVYATGLRNPQELAFDEYGNLFTFDNDCDNGDSERLVYIAEGSDNGWRVGYQYAPLGKAGPWMLESMWTPRHEGQPEYIIPPLANIEDGPSGVAYYPGSGLHPRYKGHFFVCQFRGSIASSGVYTYTVKPNGASFELDEKKLFLKGVLPTDVVFAPDGKFYLSDWTPGWPKSSKGRIYTVSHSDTQASDLVKETQSIISQGMGKRDTHELLRLLSHEDWRVRLEAQYELVRQEVNPEYLYQVASADTEGYHQLHATWALGQLIPNNPEAARSVLQLSNASNPEVRAQAAKLIGDHNLSAGYHQLIASLDDDSDRVKYFAGISLGKLGNPEAADALIGLLLLNNDRDVYLRHAAIMGLVGSSNKSALARASKSSYRAARLGALLTYRRLQDPAVANFLTDSDHSLVQEAARAIIGANISKAFPALAALSNQPDSLDYLLGLRVLNAHFRLGSKKDAQALAAFAANANASDELRAEAVHHLSTWEHPPARDRVIGLFRPLPSRDVQAAKDALTSVFDTLLEAPEQVQSKAIETATQLNLAPLTKNLFSKFQSSNTPTSVRITILNTLLKLNDSRLEEAAKIANASNDQNIRLATLPILAKLSPASSAPLLQKLATTGSSKEKRAAFKALGTMSHPIAIATLKENLQKLASGGIPQSAHLELLEAAEAAGNTELNKLLEERNQAIAATGDPLAPYEYALAGGNQDKGRKVFESNGVMPCIRCHVVDGPYSGEPGPSLMGIGSIFDAKYLLESIIKPSNQMAEGFEMAIVTTKSGEILAGFVTEDSDAELKLKLTDGNTKAIAKTEVASRQTAPSTMPEIFGSTLSRQNMRNLITYLTGLTETFEESDHALEGF